MPTPLRPGTPHLALLHRLVRASLLALAVGACERPVELLQLRTPPPEARVAAGDGGLVVTAIGTFSDGTTDGVAAEWVSSAPSVATAGPCVYAAEYVCVQAGTAGEAVLTAAFQGLSASTKVTVE